VALTLRLVCGVATADIARAFLVTETTMAARVPRAKKKIAVARIPYRVPGPAELPQRLDAVLNVIHLLFTTGHTAPSGPALVRADLIERAVALAGRLRALLPHEPEVRGLQALLLVTDARRVTRTDGQGRLVRLADQDRSRWDAGALAEAEQLITGCLRAGPPGRYVLQAAIASLYADAPSYEQTDWPSRPPRATGAVPGKPRPFGRQDCGLLPGSQAPDQGVKEGLVRVERIRGEHQALELEGDRAVERRPDLLGDLDRFGGGDHAGRRGQVDDADQRAEGGRGVLADDRVLVLVDDRVLEHDRVEVRVA
jgi:RNA polymerase sigma-70 factor (ECF subfamily)